jgi:putative ABC transport system ATP-binding protein
LDFSIAESEMVAVTGQSGAGKTTLLNCIGLLEKVDAGSLSIFGVDMQKVGARQRRNAYRSTFGWLFQNYGLVENWSVARNIKVGQTSSELTMSERRAQLARAIEQVGLRGRLADPIHTLSGGEQQRVALARLIVKRPRIILADEPTGALDSVNGAMVATMLKAFADGGSTVIVSTHDEELVSHCSREIRIGD